MNWKRPAGRLALGLLLTAVALPAAAAGTPEGPVCRAAQRPASEPIVRVLTLDDLAPERAARLRARLLQPRAGGSVVAPYDADFRADHGIGTDGDAAGHNGGGINQGGGMDVHNQTEKAASPDSRRLTNSRQPVPGRPSTT